MLPSFDKTPRIQIKVYLPTSHRKTNPHHIANCNPHQGTPAICIQMLCGVAFPYISSRFPNTISEINIYPVYIWKKRVLCRLKTKTQDHDRGARFASCNGPSPRKSRNKFCQFQIGVHGLNFYWVNREIPSVLPLGGFFLLFLEKEREEIILSYFEYAWAYFRKELSPNGGLFTLPGIGIPRCVAVNVCSFWGGFFFSRVIKYVVCFLQT